MEIAERRKSKRINALWSVFKYNECFPEILGYIKNISPHGLKITTRHKLETGQNLKIKIRLPKKHSTISLVLTVQVRHINKYNGLCGHDYETGVNFTNLTDDQKEHIYGFLKYWEELGI
jgi:hypothetical protein